MGCSQQVKSHREAKLAALRGVGKDKNEKVNLDEVLQPKWQERLGKNLFLKEESSDDEDDDPTKFTVDALLHQGIKKEKKEKVPMANLFSSAPKIIEVEGNVGNTYTVNLIQMTCTCKSFKYRKKSDFQCKHFAIASKVAQKQTKKKNKKKKKKKSQ